MEKNDFTIEEIFILLFIQTLINDNPSLKEKILSMGGKKNA